MWCSWWFVFMLGFVLVANVYTARNDDATGAVVASDTATASDATTVTDDDNDDDNNNNSVLQEQMRLLSQQVTALLNRRSEDLASIEENLRRKVLEAPELTLIKEDMDKMRLEMEQMQTGNFHRPETHTRQEKNDHLTVKWLSNSVAELKSELSEIQNTLNSTVILQNHEQLDTELSLLKSDVANLNKELENARKKNAKYEADLLLVREELSSLKDHCRATAVLCGKTKNQGVSTTALLGRVLAGGRPVQKAISPWTGSTGLILTTEKIAQFSQVKPPNTNERIVYAPGAFDLFHVGHVDFLAKAKDLGDYLIIGLYSDECIKQNKGGENHPIMNLQERLLNMLSCKYVSDVVIGAPYIITKELIDHLHIDVVVIGQLSYMMDQNKFSNNNNNNCDPFKYVKDMQKLIVIDSGSDVTTQGIIDRIVSNRAMFEERNLKKEEKELTLINQIENDQRTIIV